MCCKPISIDNWKHHVHMLRREDQFTNMYQTSYSSSQKLVGILKPKILIHEKQAWNHSQGQEPIVTEIILHSMLHYLAGGAYQDIRTTGGISVSSSTMPYARVLTPLTLQLN